MDASGAEQDRTLFYRTMVTIGRPELWPEGDDDAMSGLLLDALVVLGTSPGVRLIEPVTDFYRRCIEVLSEERRLEVYLDVQQRLFAGLVSIDSLLPFILTENTPGIVATATLDFAVHCKLLNEDPLTGPRVVGQWISSVDLANRGAVFGGLVNVGDSRVLPILNEYRSSLLVDDIKMAAHVTTGIPTLGALEFWLGWMEDVMKAGLGHTNLVPLIATGLIRLVVGKSEYVRSFSELKRQFGYRPDPENRSEEDGTTLIRKLSLDEVAARYGERMYALEAAEPPPKIMSGVLVTYGLEPRARPHERAVPP